MLETSLLFAGFTAIGLIVYKYGKNVGVAAKTVSCVDRIEHIQECNIKTIEEKDNMAKQTSELLFLLTDLMHDSHVFEVFSHEEINELFVRARMVTRYNELSTIEDVTKLIKQLQQNELTQLYPGYYESLSKTSGYVSA